MCETLIKLQFKPNGLCFQSYKQFCTSVEEDGQASQRVFACNQFILHALDLNCFRVFMNFMRNKPPHHFYGNFIGPKVYCIGRLQLIG